MILKHMNIGILPYSDGSGYQFEVGIKEGVAQIVQGGDIVTMKRDEWAVVETAMNRLWDTQDKVGD
jgi:hypothetical protein